MASRGEIITLLYCSTKKTMTLYNNGSVTMMLRHAADDDDDDRDAVDHNTTQSAHVDYTSFVLF